MFLLVLFSCSKNNKCKIPNTDASDYELLYASYSVDTSCTMPILSDKRKVYFSFSNIWDDDVIVSKAGKVVFCDTIVSSPSAGVTFKGFVLEQESNSIDSITVYLIGKKAVFNVRFSYIYQYVKLYKIDDSLVKEYDVKDPVRVRSTNCVTPVY